jgi:hypothetical protein
MATQKAAGLVTDIMYSGDVRRIYGVVGDSLNRITESMRTRGDIDWIHTRHEGAIPCHRPALAFTHAHQRNGRSACRNSMRQHHRRR